MRINAVAATPVADALRVPTGRGGPDRDREGPITSGVMSILTGMDGTQPEPTDENAPLAVLLENHRRFLSYLTKRVGDRALAEDILQDAFAKVAPHPEHAPTDEGLVPWFYRSLRNAAIDQFRRRGAADRALTKLARELETHDLPTPELTGEICACVMRLADTLKPEYADALRAVEVQGAPVKQYAQDKGLTPSNAAVRVFRAREALKKRVVQSCGTCAEHGCENCTCRQSA